MTIAAVIRRKFLSPGWEAINRRLRRADIQPICLLILAIYSIMLILSFVTQEKGRTAFGPQLGADFQQFYVAGVIFNSQGPGRIYDRDLQRRLYHELFPDTAPDTELPMFTRLSSFSHCRFCRSFHIPGLISSGF